MSVVALLGIFQILWGLLFLNCMALPSFHPHQQLLPQPPCCPCLLLGAAQPACPCTCVHQRGCPSGLCARRSSLQDCGGPTNPSCGTSNASGDSCIGFDKIQLPAVDGVGPHVIVVYSLSPEPGSFEFEAVEARGD